MYKLHPIPIFDDNYVWCLSHQGRALVVDPGDAAPVAAYLQAQGLALAAVLVTHHHADHTAGVLELLQAFSPGAARGRGTRGSQTAAPQLYTAAEAAEKNPAWVEYMAQVEQAERLDRIDRVELIEHPPRAEGGLAKVGGAVHPLHPLQELHQSHLLHLLHGGETLRVLGLDWQVLPVGAHTAGHVAFYTPAVGGLGAQGLADAPLLFCGDTLFSAGCGRLFEGSAADLAQALAKLAVLPPETRVCCTHEYTLSNLRFAHHVEPHNADISAHTAHCQALRAQGQPTLPSTLALELQINPYLRTQAAAVQAWYAAAASEGFAPHDAQHCASNGGGTAVGLAAGSHASRTVYDSVAVTGILRSRKNAFRG